MIDYLISVFDDFEKPQVYPLIIKENNENSGYVQLVPIDNEQWEIGYHVGEKYRNNGYASEAIVTFLPLMMEKNQC